jgi:hypothetical protein
VGLIQANDTVAIIMIGHTVHLFTYNPRTVLIWVLSGISEDFITIWNERAVTLSPY